jgi:hypothetical protein
MDPSNIARRLDIPSQSRVVKRLQQIGYSFELVFLCGQGKIVPGNNTEYRSILSALLVCKVGMFLRHISVAAGLRVALVAQ